MAPNGLFLRFGGQGCLSDGRREAGNELNLESLSRTLTEHQPRFPDELAALPSRRGREDIRGPIRGTGRDGGSEVTPRSCGQIQISIRRSRRT